jgi:hypothetical protein
VCVQRGARRRVASETGDVGAVASEAEHDYEHEPGLSS